MVPSILHKLGGIMVPSKKIFGVLWFQAYNINLGAIWFQADNRAQRVKIKNKNPNQVNDSE